MGESREESSLPVPAAPSTSSEAPPSRREIAERIRGMTEEEFERWRKEMAPGLMWAPEQRPRRDKGKGKGKGVGKRSR